MQQHGSTLMNLPKKLFFTGAPGSRWSSIAQSMETAEGFNTTDRTEERNYSHHLYSGHVGAYFGTGMEFESLTQAEEAYADPQAGCMVIKSHEIALDLNGTKVYECDKAGNWMMLVYRPNDVCMEWWQQAGGFEIKYPSYEWYEDNARMAYMIRKMNENMLKFAYYNDLQWSRFTNKWVINNFGVSTRGMDCMPDVLVTLYKPE